MFLSHIDGKKISNLYYHLVLEPNLMSKIGVPLIASRFLTNKVVSSILTSLTLVIPMRDNRLGVREAKIPTFFPSIPREKVERIFLCL